MKLSQGQNMDTLGFETRAFRMRSGCDTTTPCAHLIASQEHTAIWQKNEKGVHECKPDVGMAERINAETRDGTGDLQIFSLTLSQLSYRGN